ncbi:hypothetical protein QSU96_05405 [Vibrio furnissii]|uniref:hypothetical protein n=1 Tax=Vibrio furnissii TaxID=29494 RepID=UPI00257305F9|nr:hypothetical protein [Vibrio furnissii]WJG27157.1 hypothetical protein QSU96_05405 [Vibrio furnissii]
MNINIDTVIELTEFIQLLNGEFNSINFSGSKSKNDDEFLRQKIEHLKNESHKLTYAISDPLVVNSDPVQLFASIHQIRNLTSNILTLNRFPRLAGSILKILSLCDELLNRQESKINSENELTSILDKQTSDHEKYLERIKFNAINEIRKETSAIREQLKDEAEQFYIKENAKLQSSINSYRNESRKESDELVRDLHSNFKSKLDDLDNKFNVTVGERIEHFEKRFSQLQNRNTELTTSIVNIESSISESVQESKDIILKDVYALQDQAHILKTEISNASSKLTKDIELVKGEMEKNLLKSVKEEVAKYQTARNLLKIQIEEATEIVGTLSKKAMAHEHIQQANKEFLTFIIHQILGLAFLLGAVAMSISIFSSSLGIQVPWLNWLISVPAAINSSGIDENGSVWFFKRISILLLLTAPGIYLLKEAAVHRAKENVYRQRGVQLAAIAPYLRELEPCDRQGIKKDLVKTFFSFHDGKADTKNVPDFLRDLKETMKIVRSIDKLDPHNRVRKSKRSIEES